MLLDQFTSKMRPVMGEAWAVQGVGIGSGCPPRSRTINTLPTLPAAVHLALVIVWLWATTSNAQVVGTVNQGTVSTASGE